MFYKNMEIGEIIQNIIDGFETIEERDRSSIELKKFSRGTGSVPTLQQCLNVGTDHEDRTTTCGQERCKRHHSLCATLKVMWPKDGR